MCSWIVSLSGARDLRVLLRSIDSYQSADKLGVFVTDVLNHCWTRSKYRDPYTKKWWQAQQTVAEAIDDGLLSMSDDERDALMAQWRDRVEP